MTRKVDRLSCIRYGSARYSVPTRLIGTSVAIVVDCGALLVLEPATGVIVAEHELAAPGTASILDDHYDGPRPLPARAPRPKTMAEKQFCALGADAEAFLVGAAAAGNTRLGHELDILLGLAATHGQDALVAALRRAVAFGRFRAADVRSILTAHTGTPSPAPPVTLWCWTCRPPAADPWTPTASPMRGAPRDHHQPNHRQSNENR